MENLNKKQFREERLETETIADILERHYNSVNVIGELTLGDIENDIEFKIKQALKEQREEIESECRSAIDATIKSLKK